MRDSDVRDAVLRQVRLRNGEVRVPMLLHEVMYETGVDSARVTAVMWDLVEAGELDYGTDATVRSAA